jgi:hypothetical protein
MPDKVWFKIGVATMWVAECAPVARAQRGPTGNESPSRGYGKTGEARYA